MDAQKLRFRWFVAAMLFAGGAINYLDRAVLSITAPLISDSFGLTTEQLGWVFSAFFVGYMATSFLGGYAADRYGAKRVLALSMLCWSLFCGLTALATGFWTLFLLRVMFGVGEGPLNSTINKTVNNWFPPHERASALGFVVAGQPLGGALAGPIAGSLAATWGWQAPFIVVAIIGVLWTLAWVIAVSESPSTDGALPDMENGRSHEHDVESRQREVMPLGFYIRQPVILATAFAFFGFAYVAFFFLSWFPTYLTKEQGLSIAQMSWVNVVPWTCGFVGLIIGGLISDALYRRSGDALRSRKIVLVTGLAMAGCCVALAGVVSDLTAAIALMAVAIFVLYVTGNTYWAILQDVIPSARMGGVGGFIATVGTVAGIIGPALTGYIVERSGGFALAFVFAGAVAFVGAAIVALLAKPINEPAAPPRS